MIRRELIDMARSRFGPQGWGANHDSPRPSDGPTIELVEQRNDSQNLDKWSAFHEYVENLPDDDRRLLDLLWYQG